MEGRKTVGLSATLAHHSAILHNSSFSNLTGEWEEQTEILPHGAGATFGILSLILGSLMPTLN